MAKKLYKSAHDRKVSGVCGGLAEYTGVDATLIRLIWAVATVFTAFSGVLIYIVAAVVMSDPPRHDEPIEHNYN